MKVSVNDVRVGNVLEHKDRLWFVVKTEHVKPGKGPAYLQVELKSVEGNTKLNERLRTADTIERVRLDEAAYQYLYEDGEQLVFMDQESFEQLIVDKALVGEAGVFLSEGMVCTIQTHEGRPLGIALPETVVREIAQADPVVKGQTASSSYKPAVLDNGVRIMVPPHIEAGTRVVVNTNDASYVERAKG